MFIVVFNNGLIVVIKTISREFYLVVINYTWWLIVVIKTISIEELYLVTCENYLKFKFQNPRFYCDTVTLIRLHIFYSCFHTAKSEWKCWGQRPYNSRTT